jgi:hypothetical protein
MSLFNTECSVCKAKDDLIAYLKADIALRDASWQSERAEYKRTVDRLLAEKNIAPIGQGVQQFAPSTPSMDMLKIFEEVAEEKGV